MNFKKECLLLFLIFNSLFMQGAMAFPVSNEKTLHSELLHFAQERHQFKDSPNVPIEQIVKRYVRIGMSLEEAEQVCSKNGMPLSKSFNTQFEIEKQVDVYTGSIDPIFVLYNPTIQKSIGFGLEVKQGKVTNIIGLYAIESLL